MLDGCGDAVEQFADFVDGKWYQWGWTPRWCPFCVAARVMIRKAAAATDRSAAKARAIIHRARCRLVGKVHLISNSRAPALISIGEPVFRDIQFPIDQSQPAKARRTR